MEYVSKTFFLQCYCHFTRNTNTIVYVSTMFLASGQLDATELMGWSRGGDDNVPCTCTNFHTCMYDATTELMGWGRVGGRLGGGDDVLCTCTGTHV